MTEDIEKVSRFMVHSEVGKKMIAEAFYKAIFVLEKQRFPNKLLINELERLLDSDVYRDIHSTEQKEWDNDLR